MPSNPHIPTLELLDEIEARLEADKAEYSADQYDQNIRDREALLALARQQTSPPDLHDLLPQVTQHIRDLTIYASPAHIARVTIEAVTRAGYGDVRKTQTRLDAVQDLVDQAAEAESVFGRRAPGLGCVSVERLRTALAADAK